MDPRELKGIDKNVRLTHSNVSINLKKLGKLMDDADRDAVDLATGLLLEESGVLRAKEDKRFEELTVLAGLILPVFLELSDKEKIHMMRLLAYQFDKEFFEYLASKSKAKRDVMYS